MGVKCSLSAAIAFPDEYSSQNPGKVSRDSHDYSPIEELSNRSAPMSIKSYQFNNMREIIAASSIPLLGEA